MYSLAIQIADETLADNQRVRLEAAEQRARTKGALGHVSPPPSWTTIWRERRERQTADHRRQRQDTIQGPLGCTAFVRRSDAEVVGRQEHVATVRRLR